MSRQITPTDLYIVQAVCCALSGMAVFSPALVAPAVLSGMWLGMLLSQYAAQEGPQARKP